MRLASATVGPVFVAAGQNGATQTVSAGNIGTGSLSLTATSSVSWIASSIGSANSCQIAPSCVAVEMALNTAALAQGLYTGVVTVNDPNAVDAPQTIVVTVQIGSGVPGSIDLYLPPGGSASTTFTTGDALVIHPTNPAGGPTLTVSLSGGGSFSFPFSYQIQATAPAGTPDSNYSGSLAITGSAFAGDNKTVPVTAHVTSQPIASWAPANAHFRIAQGAAKQVQYIAFSNLGLGTLAVSGVTGTPAWLTASVQGNLISLTADPTGMTPGIYPAAITVASNASNGPSKVQVELDVLATGPAVTYYQGVVDNAIFDEAAVAPGDIAALFGEQLTAGPVMGAASLPLGTSMGGATVYVNNQPAPVYYVSATQIDFMIPYATPAGSAVVRVDRDGQTGNSVSLQIAAEAPRLLPLGIGNYANAVLSDPTITFPIPPTPGISSRPAKAGTDVVVFYALGLGQTNPPAVDGQAATAAQVGPVQVVFGQSLLPGTGIYSTPFYAGLTPGLVGLYQINVNVPANAPKGDAIPVYLDMGGGVISNRVNIAIE